MENRTRQKEQLVADIRQVIGELESLLRDTASDAGAEAVGLKDRLADGLRSARSTLGDLEYLFTGRARDAARATSERAIEAARLTSERARDAARFTARLKFERSSPALRAASETLPPVCCKRAEK